MVANWLRELEERWVQHHVEMAGFSSVEAEGAGPLRNMLRAGLEKSEMPATSGLLWAVASVESAQYLSTRYTERLA